MSSNIENHSHGDTYRLHNRKILITGAGSGIGHATAELFARHGATLALLDLNPAEATYLADQAGGIVLTVDVRDEEAVNESVQRAAYAIGGIDCVINAAGTIAVGPIETTSLADWQRQIDINLTGPYLICRAALPWLREATNATIVNVASAQAFQPVGASCAYAASKAGVVTFTKALAAELAPAIRANVVCPGIVDTPMVAAVQGAAGNPTATPTTDDYPLKRMAAPVEIAEAILFLTCHESSYVTGAALAVDGGRTFH